MRSRCRRVAVLAVLAVALVAAPARGHQTSSSITPVVDGFTPDVDGVRVEVRASQDATLLALLPEADTVVEVLDAAGRAWARVSSTTVEVDVSSPAFQAATNADGRVPASLPTPEDPWTVVGRDGAFQWFEHRLHPGALDVPAEVLTSTRAQDVGTWAVPLRVDGRDVELTGRLRHVPVTGRVEARLLGDGRLTPDVSVEVAPGPVPVLFLRNEGATPVTVLGRDGAPYAVVGPQGVTVNLASATRAEQRLADGAIDAAPGVVTLERVSATPGHAWLETRAALPGVLPDEEVRAAGRTVELFAWSVPVEIGDELTSIDGVTVWVPFTDAGTDGGGGLPTEWLVAVGVAALLAGVAVRRRVG